jgi:tetratricopeptide (TPR) repeat protein
VRAVLLCTGLLAGLCEGFASGDSAAQVGDAIALYKHRRYGEARAALERIVASDPSNAPACYYLAMTLQRAAPPSLDPARAWLSKAVRLAPENETYLAEYAGVTLLIADRDNSLGLALDGRDAMAKAIAMNPADLEACEGLMRFCAKAPWPLGEPDHALALAAEIAKRDPRRGSAAYRLIAGLFEKQGRKEQALSASLEAERLARAGPP